MLELTVVMKPYQANDHMVTSETNTVAFHDDEAAVAFDVFTEWSAWIADDVDAVQSFLHPRAKWGWSVRPSLIQELRLSYVKGDPDGSVA
jgi:hypothetical protein